MTDSRIFRVVGPPGTGKTTYLARQAKVATAKHGGSRVAITSLTRTAAAEIGERDTGVMDENCSTLHAAAYRALDAPDLAETPASMREFLSATGGDPAEAPELAGNEDSYANGTDAPNSLHAQVMNHRARMTPPEAWSDEEREHAALWDDFKAQTKRLDFTDLIANCLRERLRHPADPRVLLCDEAQDSSRLELALAIMWSQHTDTTVIVGDTQQALYSWRGSDPDALDGLEVSGARILEQSYRVPCAVHNIATRWVDQLPSEPVRWMPRDEPGAVAGAPFALRDTDDVLEAVLNSVDGAGGELGQTTMLLASCRYMLTPLVRRLRERGIPFSNEWRATEAAWNPLAHSGTGALLAFMRPDRKVWGDKARLWTWGDLHAWTEAMQATALQRGAKAAIKEHIRPDEFNATRADEEVPIATLVSLLGEDATDHAMGLDLAWWEDALLARGAVAARYPLEVLRSSGGVALREPPRLTIGTIHSVKGGEADHVMLAPELSREGYWGGWVGGGANRDAIVRMMYVGMTRARKRLTVLDAGTPESISQDELLGGVRA